MTVAVSPTIVERYRAGASLPQLAAEEGVAYTTVRKKLIAAGVEMRPVGGRRKYDHEAVRALRAKGLTYGQIQIKLGIHRGWAHQIASGEV